MWPPRCTSTSSFHSSSLRFFVTAFPFRCQWEIVPGSSSLCRPKGTKPKPPLTPAGRPLKTKAVGATTPGKPVVLEGLSVPALEIKTRHHFSSKLQRMSTVVRTQVWVRLNVGFVSSVCR